MRCVFLLAACTLLLAACGGSRQPGKEAFARIIQQSRYDGRCELLPPPPPFPGAFPVVLELEEWPLNPTADARTKYDALVEVGLLEVEEGMVTRSSRSRHLVQVPARTYALTRNGRDFLREYVPGTLGDRHTGFCVATYKVDAVQHFTGADDAAAPGMALSRVDYTYSPDRISPWARHASVQSAFPSIGKMLESRRSDSAMLALTDEGWVDTRP